MKKILTTLGLILSLSAPFAASATTAVPWLQTNLTDIYISPANVNGIKQGILMTASSTLLNFTFTTATGTSATTTNFFASLASSTNLFSTNANLALLLFGNATGSAATTTNLFATTASTTNFFGTSITGFGLSTCTGTSAITFTGGHFTCTAQPQGTVTAIGVTTANGVSGSSSGGATPNLTITLGDIIPTSVISAGLGEFANLWSNGSSTFQNFTGINATTSQATTTNFTVSSNKIIINSGGDQGYIDGSSTPAFNIASTTLDAMGNSFNTASSTFLLKNWPESITLNGFYCTASTTGTALVAFIHDNGNKTETSTCTSGGYTRTSTNNTFTPFEDFNVVASSTEGKVNRITITAVVKLTSN